MLISLSSPLSHYNMSIFILFFVVHKKPLAEKEIAAVCKGALNVSI